MGTSLYDLGTVPGVPDIGEMEFDLTSIDNFDDLDISMENFDLVDNKADPFGDFSLEQSFNLVDLHSMEELLKDDFNSSGDSDSKSILDDFDIKETLKQDCMWSSAGSNTPHGKPGVSIRGRGGCTTMLNCISLTPPTSYINLPHETFETPLPSDGEDSRSSSGSDSDIDVGGPSGDHSYTSSRLPSIPTPPESSEDEEFSSLQQNIYISKSAQNILKTRKSGLKEIENDRFNKDVKSILLKSSGNSLSRTNTEKPKFKFSIRMNPKGRSSSVLRKKSKQQKKSGKISSHFGIKENNLSLNFSPEGERHKQQIRISHINRSIEKEKPEQREARDVHNQMERQRRTDLKNAFDQLKDFVPSIAHSDRASKQMVLDKAIEHCKSLRLKEENVRNQRRNLVQRNELLRKKLLLLESQTKPLESQPAQWKMQGWK